MEQKLRDEFKQMGIEVSALTAEEAESLEAMIYWVPKSVTPKKNRPPRGGKKQSPEKPLTKE